MNNNELVKKVLTNLKLTFLNRSDENGNVFIISRYSNKITMICSKTEINVITIKINNISLKFVYDLDNVESFIDNLEDFIRVLKSESDLYSILNEFMFGGNYNSEFKEKRILKIENSEIYY